MRAAVRIAWTTLLLWGLQPSCRQLNANHCANLSGAATCEARDSTQPYCSICFDSGGELGCTAVQPTAECLYDPDGDANATRGTEASTSEATETETETGGGTNTTSALGTTSTADPSTGVDDNASESTGTPGSSSDGGDTAAMCGNGVAEPGESCDGNDLNGIRNCAQYIEGSAGVLACTDQCIYDDTGCCLAPGQECSNDGECCSGACEGLLPGIPLGTCD